MQQLVVADIRCRAGDPLESGIRAETVKAQQKPSIQRLARQSNSRRRCFEGLQQTGIKGGFLQHVEQSCHRPALTDLALDRFKPLRLRKRLERCNRYAVFAPPQQPDLAVLWDRFVQKQ